MSNSNKKCFVITPIGKEGSEIRREIEGIIDSGIIPALMDAGFVFENIIIPHRVVSANLITHDIMRDIITSELVIANITGFNPNVMYEVGIRDAIERPIILICNAQHEGSLPFDSQDKRTEFYVNDPTGSKQLKNRLNSLIGIVLKEGSESAFSVARASLNANYGIGEDGKHNQKDMNLDISKNIKEITEKSETINAQSLGQRCYKYELPFAANIEGKGHYYKTPFSVNINCIFKISEAGQYIATLPMGFRPDSDQYCVAHSFSTHNTLPVIIHANGGIDCRSPLGRPTDLQEQYCLQSYFHILND